VLDNVFVTEVIVFTPFVDPAKFNKVLLLILKGESVIELFKVIVAFVVAILFVYYALVKKSVSSWN